VTSVLPLSSNFDGRALAVEDQPKPRGEEISVDLYTTTPGYLRAMEIPLVKGRALDDHDTENGQMVALVNETMARRLWPEQDPLGKRVKFPGSEKNEQPWRTVVGVVPLWSGRHRADHRVLRFRGDPGHQPGFFSKDGPDERGVLREALAILLRTHGFARAAAAGKLQLQQLGEQHGPRWTR
jgi:hypothetical protein